MNDEIMTAIRAYGRAELAAERLAAEVQQAYGAAEQLAGQRDETRTEIIRLREELLRLARQDAVAGK